MEKVEFLSMFIAKKPIVKRWITDVKKCKKEKDFYMRTLLSDDGRYHEFCCPNKKCEAPVTIGFKRCRWCMQRLKWRYPFEIKDAN